MKKTCEEIVVVLQENKCIVGAFLAFQLLQPTEST